MAIKVSGIKQVQSNLQKRLEKIAGSVTEKSMTAGIIQLSNYASELTPVDTSNLINSQYTKVEKSIDGWTGGVGYTARYAAAVHEMKGTLKGQQREDFGRTSNRSEFGPVQSYSFGGGTGVGTYWSPNAEPQWLKKAAERNEDQIFNIIVKEYRRQ